MNSFASPRAKVVVAVFVAIGIIVGLHFLLFRQNAQEFVAAKSMYEQKHQELTQIGHPKPDEEINAFRYQTINYELDFWRMLRDAELASPELFKVPTTTPEEARIEKEKQLLLVWDFLHKLEELRGQPGTRLTFMNSDRPWRTDQTWAILPELPAEVRQSGRAVSDSMRDLIEIDALMDNIPEDSQLWQEQNGLYMRMLYNVGLNLVHRDGQPNFKGLGENFGDLVRTLYTLNRIDLIKRNIPRSEFGFQSETEYNRRMYDLFRLDLDEIDTFNAYKQLQALIDIIGIARKHDLREIQMVKLWDPIQLSWPPPELDKQPEESATGTGAFDQIYGGGMDPSMMYMDPSMMYGGDPSMMMYGDPSMMGMDPTMMGGMGMATPTPVDSFGGAVAIEMTVLGSNSDVMAFIYELTHNKKTYEIDMIDIRAIPREENVIGAKIVIKSMSYYVAFPVTAAEIETNIQNLLQQKREVAVQRGAIELARQEGFIDENGQVRPDAAGTQQPATP